MGTFHRSLSSLGIFSCQRTSVFETWVDRILKRRWRRFRIGAFGVRLGRVGGRGDTNT
jgi:hypothetical protein